MDKDKALDALILKTGMNPVMQGSCYVMHPEALQAVIDEAIKQALAAPVQEPVGEWVGSRSKDSDPKRIAWKPGYVMSAKVGDKIYTSPPAPVQPAPVQPVAFLANGARFKISYDSRQSGGQIHGIPPELGGRWVAFVAADDDCHLKLTTPPAAQPAPVPLTDELSNAVQMACQLSFKDHGRRSVNEQAWQRLMQAVAAFTHGITKGGAA